MIEFYEQLAAALAGTEPFALGVLSGIKGSSPQKRGAKALFFADGRIVGTLGGGCLEAEIQDRARRALRTGTPATFDLVLDHDFGWDDGLICGGKVNGLILPQVRQAAELWRELARRDIKRTWGVHNNFSIAWVDREDSAGDWLYTETLFPPCPLWVAGSGHVAQAVAPLAARLDFAVTVFDDRATFANRQFFPEGTRFQIGPWEKLLLETPPAAGQASSPSSPSPAFALIVTRGHQRDALVLARWIHQPFAFLGMIGSRRKKRLIFDQFRAAHLATEEQLKKVACPVGVEIGSVTVPEIAVSIAAQLITKRAEALRVDPAPDPAVISERRAVGPIA